MHVSPSRMIAGYQAEVAAAAVRASAEWARTAALPCETSLADQVGQQEPIVCGDILCAGFGWMICRGIRRWAFISEKSRTDPL